MAFLRQIFGPSKQEVWSQLAAQVGGTLNSGGFWGTDVLQARAGDWLVTLDTYTVSTGKSSQTYTRMRAPFVNRDGFRFSVARAGFLTEFFKWMGAQDITVGIPQFDQDWVIQGNNEAKVRALFTNPRIPPLLYTLPAGLQVIDDEGWFAAQFPQGVDELRFISGGVMKDLVQLKALFDVFAEVLNHLAHLDSAYKDDETLHIEALLSPSGPITQGSTVLWDGRPVRLKAAEALGHLKSVKAVEPLVRVLREDSQPGKAAGDPVLRGAALWALGEIGDRRATSVAIALLGDPERAGRPTVGEYAGDALRKLGGDAYAEAFAQSLRGDEAALGQVRGWGGHAFIMAFARALRSPAPATAARAAWALSELSAVEMLGRIRDLRRSLDSGEAEAKAMVDRAIAELERRKDLPRPATAPPPMLADLPLPALEPTSHADLPIPARTEPETHG